MKRQRAFLGNPSGDVPVLKKTRRSGQLARTQEIPKHLNVVQRTEVAKIVRSKEEVKYDEFLMAPTNIVIAGTVGDLFNPGQGIGVQQRIGDSARVLSIKSHFQAATGDSVNYVRMIFFRWKVNSALRVPTVSDILAVGASAAVPETNSIYNYANRKIYDILWDKTWCLSTTSDPIIDETFRFQIPDKKQQVDFNPAAVSGTNKIYQIYLSDSTAVPHPVGQGVFRVFFQDS